MLSDGYILIYRKLIRNWIWEDPKYLKAWMYILFRCNYEEKNVLFNGKLVLVPRGSMITSIRNLAKETGLSTQEIRTFLDRLKSNTVINTLTTHTATQITVCNYGKYQDLRHSDDTENDTASDNRENNIKERKKKTPPTPRGEVPEENPNPTLTEEESLEYLPDNFRGGRFELKWIEWWRYRKAERWTTKKTYAERSMADLKKLAGGDPVLARKIVEQSMGKGWRGLFALKDGKNIVGQKRHDRDFDDSDFRKNQYEIIEISTKNANSK